MGEVAERFEAEQYRAVFEAAPNGIVIVDYEGQIRDLNPSAEGLFGYTRAELLGSGIEVLVPERSRGVHRKERETYMLAPRARPMGIGLELRGRRKDGSEVPVEISLSPMQTNRGRFIIAIVRDMTERNRLRRFGVEAMRAAEEERVRIARELHDDTAQRLAALLMQLRVLRGVEDGARREAFLDGLHEELLQTAEAVRHIARGLRPPELEEVGLEAAIRALARSVRDVHGLDIAVELKVGRKRLSAEAELALYRIVQEALSNAVRHAGATCLRVSLANEGGALVAIVEDDGRGFDPRKDRDEGGGLGLLGMRERAEQVGGGVRVESAPGEGTRVTVQLPVSASPAGPAASRQG